MLCNSCVRLGMFSPSAFQHNSVNFKRTPTASLSDHISMYNLTTQATSYFTNSYYFRGGIGDCFSCNIIERILVVSLVLRDDLGLKSQRRAIRSHS